MSYKFSLVLREIVIGMLRSMVMAFAEENQHDREQEAYDHLETGVENFIEWLVNESPLS